MVPIGIDVDSADPLVLDGDTEVTVDVPAGAWGSVVVRRVEFLAPSDAQVDTLDLNVRASW